MPTYPGLLEVAETGASLRAAIYIGVERMMFVGAYWH